MIKSHHYLKKSNSIRPYHSVRGRDLTLTYKKLTRLSNLSKKYEGYNGDDNYCKAMRDEIIFEAIEDCYEDEDTRKCYNDQIEEMETGRLPVASRKLNSVIESLAPDSYSKYDWTGLGEIANGESCVLSNDEPRFPLPSYGGPSQEGNEVDDLYKDFFKGTTQ